MSKVKSGVDAVSHVVTGEKTALVIGDVRVELSDARVDILPNILTSDATSSLHPYLLFGVTNTNTMTATMTRSLGRTTTFKGGVSTTIGPFTDKFTGIIHDGEYFKVVLHDGHLLKVGDWK